jgi:methionine synthase reductase
MKNEITIIYASQTGQAKAIAESIFDLASKHDSKANIYCISKYDKEFKLNELTEPVIFISSTTGDGETPETALKCWNRLKRLNSEKDSNYLKNLNYALLGLGDTNYAQFANGPKLFHNKFKELGANCFFGPFYADDGTDLEIVVEPFKKDVWNALKNFKNNKPVDDLKQQVENLTIEYTLPILSEKHLIVEFTTEKVNSLFTVNLFLNYHLLNDLFEAKVTENKILTSKDSIKTCHSLKFEVKELHTIVETKVNDVKFEYEPGYSANVIVPNDKQEVIDLLKRLDCSSIYEKIFIKSTNATTKKTGLSLSELSIKNDLNMFNLFTYCLDIRSGSIKKALIRMLAEYCSSKSDQLKLYELCSKEGSNLFQTEIKENSLSLLDLLNRFSSCKPPIEYLIQLLSPLQARAYSFCSADSKEMEIIFNLVKFEKENGRSYPRNGVATGYLSNLEVNQSIYFFKRKIQNFTFPNLLINPKPLIMIGPGTGLAPFISFLRSILNANELNFLANVWLFYGCRDPNKDFLFKNELLNIYSKSLNHLSISFSRTNSDQILEDLELSKFYILNSKYVHDSLRYYSNDVSKLIYEQDAYVYLCGDATNMSKDVTSCLAECLSKTYDLKLEDSNKYLLEMMKNKRFKQDIWA